MRHRGSWPATLYSLPDLVAGKLGLAQRGPVRGMEGSDAVACPAMALRTPCLGSPYLLSPGCILRQSRGHGRDERYHGSHRHPGERDNRICWEGETSTRVVQTLHTLLRCRNPGS